ncbi:MAG: nitroreductase family protein [Pseudomonadales bacterium]|nr:nitroreductase family protein [Pseudomonadales bacterium]
MEFDIAMTDELLSTTRAVRKRLDFDRPVPRSIIEDCIDLSQQAPTGTNSQGWRWIVVEDAEKRAALAEIYRKGAQGYLTEQGRQAEQSGDRQTARVLDSALFLAENLQHAPLHVIPCLQGRPPEGAPVIAYAGLMGSIFPAVWSFQLALRARGLGSCLTSLHLIHEKEAAELLGIPDDVLQVALLPVAYTRGTDFKKAARPHPSTIMHWDSWQA